jgi:general secretion pathway protein G
MVRIKSGMAAAKAVAQRGMTLIEIMVVVLIMGLIMGTVGYAVFRYYKRSQIKTTKLRVTRVLDGVQEWRADNSTKSDGNSNCPASLNELVPSHFKKDLVRDAWGKELKISCQGEKVCIWSSGPNKRDENGGGDDIRACNEESDER